MGKVGGERNFGYGKKMAWVGKKALAERCGDGHYATRAAHVERWGQFVSYARGEGIKDARVVTREVINAYVAYLAGQVGTPLANQGPMHAKLRGRGFLTQIGQLR